MNRRSHRVSCGLLALEALLAGGTSTATHADVATPAADDSTALAEITVTARRRAESIHDTPVAVTAVNTAMLESKNAVNIGDLQGSVPNLLITGEPAGAAAANLSIRGLSFADIEKSFDPTVGVVIDGVFLGTNTGQYLDFFDIADFEVLRGPQGTLFGRNTIGGVINITRSRPTGEFGAKVEVSYGRFDTTTERGVFNAPVIKNVLAAKLFYFNTKTDGYYRDANTGNLTGGSQNQNFGAALLLTPGGGFDALLTLERQMQYYLPVGGTLVSSSDLFGQVVAGAGFTNEVNRNNTTDLYTVFSNPRGPHPSGHYNAPAATLQMNWDAGPVKLTAVTGYRKSFEDQVQPFDGTSLGLYVSHRIQPFHQFSEELRAAGRATATLDYVAGLYYYDGVYTLTQTTDLFGAGFGLPQVVSGEAKSAAAFLDFDWAFIDKWRLNFGGRYTRDKKSLNNTGVDVTTGKETFFGAPSATFSKFTPKASIDFRPSRQFMYYASYSVGYRSGGFSNRALDAATTNTAFQPETVDSAEVGIKSEWFDRRMSVNAAYFDAKYKNMQQRRRSPRAACSGRTPYSASPRSRRHTAEPLPSNPSPPS
jgi:iron complex outermembrane receptor protein